MELDDNTHGRVFRIEPGPERQAVRLTAQVDLDIATEAQADAELRTLMESGDYHRCVVDVAQIFVDVRGLTVLLIAAAVAQDHGMTFAVVPSRTLRTICRAARVGAALVLLDDVAAPEDRH